MHDALAQYLEYLKLRETLLYCTAISLTESLVGTKVGIILFRYQGICRYSITKQFDISVVNCLGDALKMNTRDGFAYY